MRRQALVLAAFVNTWAASAQVFTGLPPVQPPLTGQEKVPADTGIAPPSVTIKTQQLGSYVLTLDPQQNWLIAGDASQNLFQRGTTGPTVTTTVEFGPDRWAYWSGAATPMTVSQDLTAIATVPGFSAAYKMQRQAGSAGTDLMCMAQEVSSANSRMLQGQVVDLDFYVFGGANLSASQVGIYIITGTGTDEGMQKLAFGFNGGGGGSVGWTGQNRVVGAQYSPLFIGRATRPAVVGLVPTTATEVGVVLCMTPNGTAGAGDFMDFSGIQLRMAPALAPFASQFTAYAAALLPTPPFVWRLGNQETLLQQAYYWQRNEGVGLDVIGGPCLASVSLRADCFLQYPVPMGKTPSVTFAPGFQTDANSGGITPCTGLAMTPGMVATRLGVTIGCATGVNVKTATFLYENGGSGMIAVDGELN